MPTVADQKDSVALHAASDLTAHSCMDSGAVERRRAGGGLPSSWRGTPGFMNGQDKRRAHARRHVVGRRHSA